MQRIYLLSTGGTIEKVYSEQRGVVENRAAKLDRYLRMLRLPDAEVRTIQLMNKDSLEMTDADRAEVRDRVIELLPEGAPIVISHGTDTMVETGLFLERAFPDLKIPLILTGAMTPLGFEGSDALQNLTESLFAARCSRPEYLWSCTGRSFRSAKCAKTRTKRRSYGLRSPGSSNPATSGLFPRSNWLAAQGLDPGGSSSCSSRDWKATSRPFLTSSRCSAAFPPHPGWRERKAGQFSPEGCSYSGAASGPRRPVRAEASELLKSNSCRSHANRLSNTSTHPT